MDLDIKKVPENGFCFGVKRALNILEQEINHYENIETLGEVVHNAQVISRLKKLGIKVAQTVDDIKGKVTAISAHGVSPEVERVLRIKNFTVIDCTCPFVRRAQLAAKKLSENNFFTIIYGDANHSEVKGILGWANNLGIATMDGAIIEKLEKMPQRIGILSQTTQVEDDFKKFACKIVESGLVVDGEIRVIDTICHDIRKRQANSLEMAKHVDLMLVIGGCNSANTKHLAELCSKVTKVIHIETADDINKVLFKGINSIGVAGGASTAEETIDEVVKELESLKIDRNK